MIDARSSLDNLRTDFGFHPPFSLFFFFGGGGGGGWYPKCLRNYIGVVPLTIANKGRYVVKNAKNMFT